MKNRESNKSLNYVYYSIVILLTGVFFAVAYLIWEDNKNEKKVDLLHNATLLKNYYELTFNQWELSLKTVGYKLVEKDIGTIDQNKLDYANESLQQYEQLLAFGLADTLGQIQILTGRNLGDSLPNLVKSDFSRRSFLEAKKSNKISIGEAYYFNAVNDWILPIRLAIRDSLNRVIAVNTSAINYSKLIEELGKFDFPYYYRIHLVNNSFNSTQLYHPYERSNLAKILGSDADFYKNQIFEGSDFVFFDAFNALDNFNSFGVIVPLKGLNHSIVMSADKAFVIDDFIYWISIIAVVYLLIVGIFTIFFNFFEKQQLAYINKLEIERANFEALFESTTNIIAFFDLNKRLVSFNSAYSGYCRATDGIEIQKGQHILEDMKDKTLSRLINKFLDRAFVGEKFKEVIQHQDDTRNLHLLLSFNPIYIANKIMGVSLFVEDVTELKSAQLALKEYNDELSTLVNKRTVELENKNRDLEEALSNLKSTQEQLIQAEKMASLGLLSAGIGHELNNPLNFILHGLNSLVQETESLIPEQDKKAQLKPFTDIIYEGINRSVSIVKSLGHFSRKGESKNEQCDIHSILDNCLVILSNKLKNRIVVYKNYTLEDVTIIGREGKLHQAFLNILSNAEQAIENTGSITIFTSRLNNSLEVRIKDSGIGVKKEYLDKISDPFFTTKAPGKGTGLGLFITFDIIKDHNGIISVNSQENEGFEFVINFVLE